MTDLDWTRSEGAHGATVWTAVVHGLYRLTITESVTDIAPGKRVYGVLSATISGKRSRMGDGVYKTFASAENGLMRQLTKFRSI